MFTITKIQGGYKIGRRYPKENSIRVMRVDSLDTYEKMLKGDKMGLAGFNRARELAKKNIKKVDSTVASVATEAPKEEPKEQPKKKAVKK